MFILFPWKARLGPWSTNISSLWIFAPKIMILVKIGTAVDEMLVSKMAICSFEGAFILQLDQICHVQLLLGMSKIRATHGHKSNPSKAWHLVATSLAPPWVRWWKRTSCLTHPAQLRNWCGSFPGMCENTWGPFKGLRLAARRVKVRFGSKKPVL